MSVLGGYPEAMSNKQDVQIWNNAAFDNGGDSEDLNSTKLSSWSPVKRVFLNPFSDSLDSSSSSKENQSPSGLSRSPVSVKSPVVLRPLQPSNSQKNPAKIGLLKEGVVEKPVLEKGKKIDEEIEQIQNEISRLSVRLEALRLEKAEQNKKNLEKQGRVVAAKFLEQPKQGWKNRDFELKKIEETGLLSSSRTKIQRRGFSMGPTEIMTAANSSKSRQLGKQEIINITPIQSAQNRRKSCFWKLQDIEEETQKVGVSRGKNLSLSPKSRKVMGKTQLPRQAVTTVGSKKGVKKDDGALSSIQPKKLFMKDGGEKSVPGKKPLKPGRVIASRYNQSTVSSAMRKRSLPENDNDESKRCDKKRASSVGKSCGTEGRVKKRWEIPSEIVVPKKLDLEEIENDNEISPSSTSVVMPGMLPRIRAVRRVNDTPRDSGPAKRVAELVGRKSYFSCTDDEEEEEPSVCQALSFAEDFEDES